MEGSKPRLGEFRITEGDLGTNDGQVAAEYARTADIASEQPARTETAEGSQATRFAAVARAEQVTVTGIAGFVSATKAKLAGGAPIVMASDEVEIEKGGAFIALAGKEVELKDHAYVGFALSPKVEVKEGGRVFVTPLIAILIGLAIGGGFGLVAVLGYWAIARRGPFARMRARRAMKNGAFGQVTQAADEFSKRIQRIAASNR
jgi:hypothetical protein